MSNPDFTSLLNTQATEVKKPVPLPIGSYIGAITSFEFGKSSKKQTDFVKFHIIPSHAREDVDQNELAKIENLSAVKVNYSFYLTPDALFRLTKFANESLGLSLEGRNIAQIIEACVNQPVGFVITHRFNEDGSEVYAEVASTFAA